MRLSGLLLLALPAPFAWAATVTPPATVAAVQAPAWLERDGQRQPLAVGMDIRDGDRLLTGNGARAYLQLADGSLVKLGEDARLGFFSRSLAPRTYFRGALDVLAGAFRYTTGVLRHVRGRDLSIRVGAATAGIRGTDLWGKSTSEKDIICLIDGHIQVAHGGQTYDMPQPMSFFVAPRDKPPQPVAPVAPSQLAKWALETDIEAGAGGAVKGGKWKLKAGHAANEAEALEIYDKLRQGGFDARVHPLAGDKEGSWSYDLLVRGFPTEADAAAAVARLKAKTGLEASPLR